MRKNKKDLIWIKNYNNFRLNKNNNLYKFIIIKNKRKKKLIS